MSHQRTSSSRERGYSLAEMLTVVAIIGMFTLIAVPQFMNIGRSMKMRASMRQFAADVRSARQRAISQNRRVAVTMAIGLDPGTGFTRGQYEIWERTDAGIWRRVPNTPVRFLPAHPTDPIYFASTTFTNDTAQGEAGGDDRPDIVFVGNGTVTNMPGGGADATVVLDTDYDIPIDTYTFSFYGSGNFVTASD